MRLIFFILIFFTCNVFAENPKAELKTSYGSFTIELYADKTPVTVENFIKLANKKFFDGIIFHRVIKDFMSQTGDPTGTGRGGPGYSFKDEFDPTLKHDAEGIVSMANSGPNTNGSQFFIIRKPQPHLDNRHSVFGKVVKGIEVTRKINDVKTNAMDRPVEDISIQSVTLSGDHPLIISDELKSSLHSKALLIIKENLKAFGINSKSDVLLQTIKSRGKNYLLIWDIRSEDQTSIFWLKGKITEDGFEIKETHFNLVN